jgi:hypothetical protein
MMVWSARSALRAHRTMWLLLCFSSRLIDARRPATLPSLQQGWG